MYGKIEDKALTIAPQGVTEGYFPVRFTTPPEPREGGYWEPNWELINNEVVQTWVFVDMTVTPDEVDDAEAFNIIFGGDE